MEDLVLIFNMKKLKKKYQKKKKKEKENDNLKNVSIPKGINIDQIDLEKAKYLCSLTKNYRSTS